MSTLLSDVTQLLKESIVIDGLGGAVVHPTPYIPEGTYEELLVQQGWTAFNACLVSEPYYTPTWEETIKAIYENLVYADVSPKLRLVRTWPTSSRPRSSGQLGIIFGLQSS